MKIFVAVLACALISSGLAVADQPVDCSVPDELISTDRPLPRVMDGIAAKQLNIAVVGSASSTLRGANGPPNAYPAQLETELKRRLPGVAINLTIHIEPRGTASDMAATFPQVLAEKPNLVIWQSGTADLMLGNEPDAFREALDKGIAALHAGGSDVVVVNLQYSPRTDAMTNVKPYADTMRLVAEDQKVPLFDRMGIMKYWNDEGTFDFYAMTNDGTTYRVHACLGRLLADLVIGSAKRAEVKAEH
jgi:hypothetical protein